MKKVIVTGGDGFIGWPTALKLSAEGYLVTIIDNFARRAADTELGCESLTPIRLMSERLRAWKEITGKKILFKRLDVAKNYRGLFEVLTKVRPDTIIHCAEQRAAPYSMKSAYHKRYTISNNINATHNILNAIVESGLDIHLIHIGSTGVYGYNCSFNHKIPEGYLDFKVATEDGYINFKNLYPSSPGSIYHLTKCQDALMFQFYNKNDEVKITDLHQGVVWGANTKETMQDERIYNRFDYDGDYGTVLNRFLIQSVVGHPLTVYGTGGQTRAFINIQNSVECVQLAVENPPESGDKVEIYNQTTEQLKVIDLAEIIAKITGAEIRHYQNPRFEAESNELQIENTKFLELGLEPIMVDSLELEEICKMVHDYRNRCDFTKVICTSVWNKDRRVDFEGDKHESTDTAA